AVALFVPHCVWMARHDFITVRYGLERSGDRPTWVNHVKNPLQFLLSQAARLAPVGLVLLPLLSRRPSLRPLTDAGRGDRQYLLWIVLGPLALLLALPALAGSQIREIWGSPLWTFLGVLLLVALRTDPSSSALRRCGVGVGLAVLLFVAWSYAKTYVEPPLS